MRSILPILFVILLFRLHASEAEKVLNKIPQEDRKKIEELFDYFGRLGNLGHVIFYTKKPMCLTGIPLTCKKSVVPSFIYKDQEALIYQNRIKDCWFTWKEHAKEFPHSKFIFSEEVIEVAGGQYLNLYIINKNVMLKFLDENESYFASVLGSNFSPKKFLDKLISGEKLTDLLQYDEMLLGMLLGYGYKSSQAFKEKSENLVPISGKPKLDGKIGVAAVSFMTKDANCQEVVDIINVYAEELKEMATLFQNGDFPIKALEALYSK